MPKLKPSPDSLRGEIVARWQRYWDVPDDRAGQIIGASARTYQRRIADGRFEVGELLRLVDAFKIPPDDALLVLTAGSRTMSAWLERYNRKLRRAGDSD